jgi:hypothetical protein
MIGLMIMFAPCAIIGRVNENTRRLDALRTDGEDFVGSGQPGLSEVGIVRGLSH